VLSEVAEGQFENPQAYLQYYSIIDLLEIRAVSQPHALPEAERLHEGKKQAIQLALELQLPLLIEETVGRRVAQSVGIQISGIAGQIIKALRQNVISATEASSKLSELLRAGRINRKIYDALLKSRRPLFPAQPQVILLGQFHRSTEFSAFPVKGTLKPADIGDRRTIQSEALDLYRYHLEASKLPA
jgi:predicted nucleic acid-binding protein